MASISAIECTPVDQRLIAHSAFEMLKQQASSRPQAVAVVYLPNGSIEDTPEEYTYEQLVDAVTRAAHVFRSHRREGSGPVVLLLPNLPESLYLLIAAGLEGVACPINPLLEPRDIAALIDSSGAEVLVTCDQAFDGAVYERAARAVALASRPISMLLVRNHGDVLSGAASLNDEMALAPSVIEVASPPHGQIAAYFHTGGTTGRPKLASHTHYMQMVQTEISCLAFAYREGDTILTGLPLFHANALFLGGFCAFRVGGRTIIAGPDGYRGAGLNRDFWRLIEHYRVSFFSSVPTVLARLSNVERNGADLSSLRFATCGGAPIPPSLLRRLQHEFGFRVLEGYGMTEATCLASVNPRDGEQRLGSVGIRAPYMKTRIAILEESPVRDARLGEVGNLLLSGPSLMPGYHDAEANSDCWPFPGWFNSGDLASSDAEGYIWLHGRAKDLIIRGGHNIDPAAVESTVADHPAVEFAAAVAYPDPDVGEKPVLFVELKNGKEVSESELLVYARARAADPSAAPVRVVRVATLPRTAVGKISKVELRALAALDAYQRLLGPLLPVDAELVAEQHERGLKMILNIGAVSADLEQRLRERLGVCAVPLDLRTKQVPLGGGN